MPEIDDDKLDHLLRDEGYIPDDGFTHGVLRRLPTRRRKLVLSISFVLAGILLVFQFALLASDFFFKSFAMVSSANPTFWLGLLLSPSCLIGLFAGTAALIFFCICFLAYLEEEWA